MNNQDALMDCALTLFSQRGYDAVGVQEIVETAGVTKPTLYHYFDSKRGLLDALLRRESSQLLSTIQQAAFYEGDLVLTLERSCKAYFEFASQHANFYRMHLSMVLSPPESEANLATRPYAKEQFEILTRLFIQATEDHGNLRGRHDRYAAGFLGAINAMIGLYLNNEFELSDEVVFNTVHQFMHGIFS